MLFVGCVVVVGTFGIISSSVGLSRLDGQAITVLGDKEIVPPRVPTVHNPNGKCHGQGEEEEENLVCFSFSEGNRATCVHVSWNTTFFLPLSNRAIFPALRDSRAVWRLACWLLGSHEGLLRAKSHYGRKSSLSAPLP